MLDQLLRIRSQFVEENANHPDAIDRLALFIYGISPDDYWLHLPPRKDGVIKGVDCFLTSSETPEHFDDDARRIALFYSTTSPYKVDVNGHVWVANYRTGLSLSPFIYKQYIGPAYSHYLRSDRANRYTRLVVNPFRNCYARCKWCARTYQNHIGPTSSQKSEATKLQADNTPPRGGVAIDMNAIRLLPQEVISPKELISYLLDDPSVVNKNHDLRHLTEVAILSGDFPNNLSAISYLVELSELLKSSKFEGSIYYAGHQIEDESDMILLSQSASHIDFVYTVEHFSRREELMPVKGKRSMGEVEEILRTANRIFGIQNVYYYYIAGIDPIQTVKEQFIRLRDIAIPQVFAFTPYNLDHTNLYYHSELHERLQQLLDIRAFMLDLYNRAIPGGSNRSLFPLES